jgi:glycosyltransferase involved in cell wall biosynthesis
VLDSSRVCVIPASLGEEWFSAEAARVATPHYVLAVSGVGPSKNLSRAIAAFAQCRALSEDSSLRLKVAGVKERFHPVFQAEARQLGVADFVDFMNYISDAEMHELFKHAKLFIMPSIAEGFGIPVLEAMASGVPVAASSSTCLQEVGSNAAHYFDPYSIEGMAATMHKILANPALQEKMSEQGRIQSRKFHPNVVREQVRAFWAELEGFAIPEQGTEYEEW